MGIGVPWLAAALCLASAGCVRPARESANRASTAPSELEQSIFDAVNGERGEREIEPLEWSDEALEVARNHSERMARLGYFSHEDPELGGLDARMRRLGVRAWSAGENLFAIHGHADPVSLAVEGWLKSPGHRQNMLNSRFTRSAVGIARADDGTIYCTQVFLRPFPLQF